ncbi:MAG: FtsX-like permease family protein, partial [Longimicrobiales bacterium]
VLGEVLDFGYEPYVIIGVAPRGFTGEDLDRVDVWLPLAPMTARMRGDIDWIDRRTWYWLRVVGRLAPGAVPSTAEAEATTLHRQGRAEAIEAGDYDAKAEVLAAPLIHARGPLASEESAVATWLAGVSAIVLLIVCANVANLLLARAVGQRRETGVRLALGSSRRRILGQALTESLLLAVVGGAAALLLTRWGGDVVRGVLLPDVSWEDTGLGLRVAGVVAALALLTGIVSGVIPAFQTSRSDFMDTLKSTAASHSRTRSVLTVVQTAMSVVLLIGAGLFVRSLHEVEDLDLGFDPEGVLLVETEFERGTPDERLSRFFRLATERLDGVPGVAHASAALSVPFWSINATSLRAPGVDSIPMLPTGSPAIHVVDHDHFLVMDLQILRVRGLRSSDTDAAASVVVVNETMARVVWQGKDAIGECLIIGGDEGEPEPPCATVVGVVENTRNFDLVEEESMHYYVPLAQAAAEYTPEAILVRTRGVGQDVIPVLRSELMALDPALRFAEIVPLQDQIDPRARSWKLGAALFAAFGVLALVVAAIGLYSVLAFSVAQRTFELGVRSALGATRERLVGLILGQALRLTAIGIALGLAIALFAGPTIEPLLFDVSPRDPLILTSVAILLGLVALVAGCVPAWRATKVVPSMALKAE